MSLPAEHMNSLPERRLLVQALNERDSDYEGVFVTAVKTTGIFCRPGCPCKTPKEENVEFYHDAAEAAINSEVRSFTICSRPWLMEASSWRLSSRVLSKR